MSILGRFACACAENSTKGFDYSQPQKTVKKKEEVVTEEEYLEALAEFIYNHHDKRENKARCFAFAKDYRAVQRETVQELFRLICESTAKPNGFFVSMEDLLQALDQLCLPLPDGFQESFTVLALECLPKRLFLQYLERGVCKITPKLVDFPPEPDYLPYFPANLLAKHLSPKDRIEPHNPEASLQLESVESLLSALPSTSLDLEDSMQNVVFDEAITMSTFMPMDIFLLNLSKALPPFDPESLAKIRAAVTSIYTPN